MMFRRCRAQGFTLIELMVVIAIIGIMATMAVPSYRDRIVRTQVKEAIELAGFSRDSVQAYYKKHRRLPANNAEAGLPPAEKIVGNYVTRLQVEDGAVHLQMGNNAHRQIVGKTLTIRPAIVEGYSQVPIAWICGMGGVPAQMHAGSKNRTDLLPHFLPVDCRPGPAG